MEKVKIYGFFNSLEELGDAQAVAVDENGELAATHICSDEDWASKDLGMEYGSTRKHDIYDEKYGVGGWETEFVFIRDNRDTHVGLQVALAKASRLKKTQETADAERGE